MHEDLQDVDNFEDYNKYLTVEVLLPQNGEHMTASTKMNCSKDKGGALIGAANINLSMYTCVYYVMFPDGAVQQY